MIVITLPKGAEPGNPADEKYQKVTRVYDDQLDGKPYITAEFEREESRTTFTVGDGKYYSRSDITDAMRKRRTASCKLAISTRLRVTLLLNFLQLFRNTTVRNHKTKYMNQQYKKFPNYDFPSNRIEVRKFFRASYAIA